VKLGRNASDNEILKANGKIYIGNCRRVPRLRKAHMSKSQMKTMLITFSISRSSLFTLNSFHKANIQPSLIYGNIEAVYRKKLEL
jgi:hypothetical protein